MTCNINTGGRDELNPGEVIEIRISDFRDEKGRDSKAFNRIIVEVQYGRIKGGTALAADKGKVNRLAFSIKDAPVRFTYEGPSGSAVTSDKITVYSSCQILDQGKVPLTFTEPFRKIAEKEISLVRPDLIATYNSVLEELPPEPYINYLLTYTGTRRALYHLIKVIPDKENGTVTESYKLITSNLENLIIKGELSYEKKSANCIKTGKGSATGFGGRIVDKSGVLRNTYDAKSGEVLNTDPDDFTVECSVTVEITEQTKCIKPPKEETGTISMWPMHLNPTEKQLMVMDDPEHCKATGNRDRGIISGGGTKIIGLWRLTVNYTFEKKGKK